MEPRRVISHRSPTDMIFPSQVGTASGSEVIPPSPTKVAAPPTKNAIAATPSNNFTAPERDRPTRVTQRTLSASGNSSHGSPPHCRRHRLAGGCALRRAVNCCRAQRRSLSRTFRIHGLPRSAHQHPRSKTPVPLRFSSQQHRGSRIRGGYVPTYLLRAEPAERPPDSHGPQRHR